MAIKTTENKATWAVLTSSGSKFCDYDSIDVFVDSGSAQIPTEPQEGGQLFSYDKVRLPNEATVTLIFSGRHGDSDGYSNQGSALARLRGYLKSTETFLIQTPSTTMTNMAVVGLSVTRNATSSANMLVVEVTFKEVMNHSQSAKGVGTFSPQNATSADTQSLGTHQSDSMRQESLLGGEQSQSKIPSVTDKVVSIYKGAKESISSAVSTVRGGIQTVRSNMADVTKKVQAETQWARTQMSGIASDVTTVKGQFVAMKEEASLGGIKRTFWGCINDVKGVGSSAKDLLKEFGL